MLAPTLTYRRRSTRKHPSDRLHLANRDVVVQHLLRQRLQDGSRRLPAALRDNGHGTPVLSRHRLQLDGQYVVRRSVQLHRNIVERGHVLHRSAPHQLEEFVLHNRRHGVRLSGAHVYTGLRQPAHVHRGRPSLAQSRRGRLPVGRGH